MEASITQKKLKWRENQAIRQNSNCITQSFPFGKPKTGMVRSMMMDARFTSTDRAVLVAIALHYNLKNGDCFPAHGRIAIEAGFSGGETGETGRKAVQRAVNNAVKFGWIKRTFRRGGARNQTNLYELTLPQSIWDVLTKVGPTGQIGLPTGQNRGRRDKSHPPTGH